jgi:drug/metabolite transporter (DMT)-like permease
LSPHAGELAALTTGFCWACSSILFTLAGRRLPLTALNLLRTGLGALLLALTLLLITGRAWPGVAPSRQVLELGLSGLIGLAIGDNLLFHGYQWIGPRLSSLLMTLVPPISATIAWLHLGERLEPADLGGMALVLSGVVWVIAERRPAAPPAMTPAAGAPSPSRHRTLGVLCGIGAAICQSLGAIFAKRGMAAIEPLPATLIRMVTAFGVLALALLVTRRTFASFAPLRERRVLGTTLAASLLGPYLGVWLSLFALHRTEAGVALTLMALTPIFVIPTSRHTLGEHTTRRAIAGTVLAVAGVALLLRPA